MSGNSKPTRCAPRVHKNEANPSDIEARSGLDKFAISSLQILKLFF